MAQTKTTRNKKIREMYEKGIKQAVIARAFGITRQRVYELLKSLSTPPVDKKAP